MIRFFSFNLELICTCEFLGGIPVGSHIIVIGSCISVNANKIVSHTCTLWVPIFQKAEIARAQARAN